MISSKRMITVWAAGVLLAAAACRPGPEPPASNEPVEGEPRKSSSPAPTETLGSGGAKERGKAFVNQSELLIMESYPIQVSLHVQGDLPNPCHQLAYEVQPANEQGQIHVEVYSLFPADVLCVQVIEPFEVNIPISTLDIPLKDGVYTVWVNGELVGEFNYPGG